MADTDITKESNRGRPLKFKDSVEMQKKIDKYFSYCEVNEKPLTMTGLANALGIERHLLVQYSLRDEFTSTIKEAKAKVQQYAEESLYTGKNVAGVIFNLKNNHGWKDEKHLEQNVTGGLSLGLLFDRAQLADKPKIVEVIEPESELIRTKPIEQV